jgi:hypothetical protein
MVGFEFAETESRQTEDSLLMRYNSLSDPQDLYARSLRRYSQLFVERGQREMPSDRQFQI